VEDEKASLYAYVEARFSLIQTEIEKKFGWFKLPFGFWWFKCMFKLTFGLYVCYLVWLENGIQ
jgi:hypothetical protein